MKIIKPKKLSPKDTIGIISPASSPNNSEDLKNGINYLEKLGYRVKVAKNAENRKGYLAGDDKQRVSDLHDMFLDKDVKAIFCTRGGFGSTRILDKIDYAIVKKNPKIFIGYSDITALQLAFF